MRVTTMDPMTLNDVKDINNAPYVLEGEAEQSIKIYFETETSRQEYVDMEIHGSDGISGLKGIYAAMAENPDTGSIN